MVDKNHPQNQAAEQRRVEEAHQAIERRDQEDRKASDRYDRT